MWNPEQYERFRDERTQPFLDLMALVRPRPNMRVIDLGCGTGELTRLLHEHLQARETVGLDNSAAMLARSDEFAGDGLRFEMGDIDEYTIASAQPYDLIFSNAALQWVPGHREPIGRLTAALAEGGQLAVQVPANQDHPSHVFATELALEEPFREALGGYVRQSPVLRPDEYSVLLDRSGFREQHVRLQVYPHRLRSREDVVEWVKGTLLTDYRRRMPPGVFARFLERYRDRLLASLEEARPFFFPFKRILFWAAR
jgi:trans-aconitate 2-methyltransferase